MQGDQGGEQAIHDAFGDLPAGFVQHRVIGHQVTHVAHEHQAAARQYQFAAVCRGEDAVGIQGPTHGLSALVEGIRQVAAHQAQPVAVHQGLVLGIYRGHRVLAILDGGQRRFQYQVLDAGGVAGADGAGGIDLDLDMQAVVAQQDTGWRGRIPGITAKLLRRRQRAGATTRQGHLQLSIHYPVSRRGTVVSCGEGAMAIQEVPGEGDDFGSPHRVIGSAALGPALLGDHIGAIQCVVQAAPARIGRVQRVTGIHDGYYQLGAGERGDFIIHVFGGDGEILTLRQQVADLHQECLVSLAVITRPGMGAVPGVDLALQFLADLQQLAIARPQFLDDSFQCLPEMLWCNAGTRGDLVLEKFAEARGDLQAAALDSISHGEDPRKVLCGFESAIPGNTMPDEESRAGPLI